MVEARMKTVLIIGAEGYIALHAARALSAKGHRVLTASRHKSSDYYMDVTKPETFAGISPKGIDAVLYTVAQKEPTFNSNAFDAVSDSAKGIVSSLDFCVRNKINEFIYMSSFHVLGKTSGRLDEDTPPAPAGLYGLLHAFAEQMVLMYNRNKKLNGWILRASNLFGTPLDIEKFSRWELIPFAFCREAVVNGTITLRSAGKALRNFVGVGDVCACIINILEKTPEQRLKHVYGNETISVYEFAETVKKQAEIAIGKKIEIIRPNGEDTPVYFSFTSKTEDYVPADDIESFVREFLIKLNNLKNTGGLIADDID